MSSTFDFSTIPVASIERELGITNLSKLSQELQLRYYNAYLTRTKVVQTMGEPRITQVKATFQNLIPDRSIEEVRAKVLQEKQDISFTSGSGQRMNSPGFGIYEFFDRIFLWINSILKV